MTSLDRVTIASRAFCLAAIVGLGLSSQNHQVIVSLLVIAVTSMTAVYVSMVTPLPPAVVVTIEAAVTGLVIGLALPAGQVLLPYLVVLALIAGISRGLVGVSAVILAQFCAILLVTLTLSPPHSRTLLYHALSPWVLTSVGAGLLGAWLKQAGNVPDAEGSDTSYESARRLLSQLRTVARRLSSGLDPVTMASQLLSVVVEQTTPTGAAVFVRTEGGLLSPLAYTDDAAREEVTSNKSITDRCWAEMEPIVERMNGDPGRHVAVLPLRVGSRMIGVVVAHLTAAPDPGAIKSLMRELDDLTIRMDTALVFDEVRSIATVEERRRLAREIHDGVAQEVASLGYWVDDLVATAETEVRRQDLQALRAELTRVVNELRLSIFDLRSEVLAETGLGSALSEYVRQVGSRSNLTVHLTLDEAPTRLRAETETELLRIGQEAITNARKHSGAENLWVDCSVHPPFARLEVRDDGSGLTNGRADSYGLRIMRERAQRLDARLEIRNNSDESGGPGALVRVTLGREPIAAQECESEMRHDPAGADSSSTR